MATVAEQSVADCPPQQELDQEAPAKPVLAKMDSSSALEGVVSSTQPVTVRVRGCTEGHALARSLCAISGVGGALKA